MILDPTDQFIHQLSQHCPLEGATLLEIGCGRGRLTSDLARHARRVVATDPDPAALATARATFAAPQVEFIRTSGQRLAVPREPFDLALYSLSLHHIPKAAMGESLRRATALVKPEGSLVVIEPGDEGSLIEAEERFGVGCGDEREAKVAAVHALHDLPGWRVAEPVRFRTFFHFDHEEDFLTNLQPDYRNRSANWRHEVTRFLATHREKQVISLCAERRMYLLSRSLSE